MPADDTHRAAGGSTVAIESPPGFSFLRTVYSHGWFDLPPFTWNEEERSLRRVLVVGAHRPLLAEIRAGADGGLRARIAGATSSERRAAREQIRHMFRLDEEYGEFHSLCRASDGFGWVPEEGGGRLLRAPDPFEDLVKMICTTNCTWSLTRVMVRALVAGLGSPSASAGEPLRSFPSAEAMAGAPMRFYVREAKAGYRAAYLRALAESVASGRLNPSRWLDPDLGVDEIRREITSVKGAGRYVADNMLKLLGRYEGLGIDSWCRRKFKEMHGRGRRVTDRSLERFYAPFGRWRGLALWCDLTRDWFTEGEPARLELTRQKY